MRHRLGHPRTPRAAVAVALTLLVVGIAGCGSSADPATGEDAAEPLPTAEPTIASTGSATATAPPTEVPPPPEGPTAAPLEPVTTPTLPAGPVAKAAELSTAPLTLRGMGQLEIGMTVAEAVEATGLTIRIRDDAGGGTTCRYAQVVGDPQSPWLMVVGPDDGYDPETIVRIELAGASATLSGIHIGSTKDEVLDAYADRIEVTPHKYTFAEGGEYLTFVPADAADADYRLIFETLDDEVTEIRSGLLPAVEWVEGCL